MQQSPDEEGDEHPGVRPDLIGAVREHLASGAAEPLRAIAASLKAPDCADLIELLEPDERVQLINSLGADFDAEVFSELDPSVRDQLSEDLPNEVLARIVSALETDDAAYVIENLE
ncbi:MAG: magnesium transporter, partial [Hyphomicrobiaceae bacterium]